MIFTKGAGVRRRGIASDFGYKIWFSAGGQSEIERPGVLLRLFALSAKVKTQCVVQSKHIKGNLCLGIVFIRIYEEVEFVRELLSR